MIDRQKFFSSVRHSVFPGRLGQSQVDGMNVILDTWDASAFVDLRWLAYMLGTAYHETAATMQPIREYGSYDYFERMYGPYGKRPDTARRMGNTKRGDGAKYCGRGFVQLTWQVNYKNAGALLGLNLVDEPNLAMEPAVAARIMFAGMTDQKIVFEDLYDDQNFSFTGRTLEDYFNGGVEDWYNARRIINSTDHAWLISETARDFYRAVT